MSINLQNYLVFRYSAQSKFADAEDLLFDGAMKLFTHKQIGSGTDLAKLFVEVLEKTNERTSAELEKSYQRLAKLFREIPIDSPDIDTFKATTIRWAATQEHPAGHPRLHQLMAYNLWSSKR